MDFMRNVFAELQVFKRVGHCHDWGASFMSCGIHQHARPFPQLFKLLQLSKRCRMANVAAAIAEAVEAMEAADAAVIQGDAPLIEDGEDEEPAEPARDDGGAGDDQAIQAVPADPAVPAVQAQGALVPAGENVVARSMRQEIAEGVMAAVGSTPFHLRMEGMLLEQAEVQRHAIALPQAPSIFREKYDTQSDFTWSLFGFNTLLNSFYENGVKNAENIEAICAGTGVSKSMFFLPK